MTLTAPAGRQDPAGSPAVPQARDLELHHGDAPPGPAVAPQQGRAAIRLADLTVGFPGRDRPAVDRLSLTVEPGARFGLLGPNGSGKTTTINMITGLLKPTSGTVEIFGRPPQQALDEMGLVAQDAALYARLSAPANLGFHASLYGYRGRERQARIEGALELANLRHEAVLKRVWWWPRPHLTGRRVGTFSGGMARRLAIARALVHSPRLVILDEPTLGVDPNEKRVLWEHIRQLRASGVTILVTTNDMAEAAALCDQIAILYDGVLAAPVDTPENLQRRYGGAVITVTTAAAADDVIQGVHDALCRRPEIQRVEVTRGGQPGEYQLQVTATREDPVTGQIIMLLTERGATVQHVAARKPSLDEVFAELTGGFRVRR